MHSVNRARAQQCCVYTFFFAFKTFMFFKNKGEHSLHAHRVSHKVFTHQY